VNASANAGQRVALTSVVRAIMLRKLPRFVLFVLLALITNPIARAQSSESQALAAGMSNALTRAKVRTVVVFDFMGSDGKLTEPGQNLADAFSRTLATSGGQFEVIDRTLVRALIEKNRVAPDVIRDPEIAWWLANQLNADAAIFGVLTPLYGGNLKIEVKSAKTKDGGTIGSMSVKFPLSDEMRIALSNSVSVDHMKDRLDPKSPKELLPKCIYCPRPEYSGAAMAQKIEGRITLIVKITEDGIARDIEFVKSLQNGLTQRAIEAIQKWKFEPSHDPDGKPRAVWEVIEITFHLR
jgi:TonB family protein